MRSLLVLVSVASLATGALAAPEKDRAARPGAAASSVTPSAKPPTAAQVDQQLKSMQEMHAKMMAASTPQERQALMAEHAKAMQDGMAMMGRMGPGHGMGPHGDRAMGPHMMSERMDMMQTMMQMMMDREAAASAPASK